MSNDYFDILMQNAGNAQDNNDKGDTAILRLRADTDCYVLCDGALIATLKAGEFQKVDVVIEQHLIGFQSTEYSQIKTERQIDAGEVGRSYLVIEEGLMEKVNQESMKIVSMTIKMGDAIGTYTGRVKNNMPAGSGTFVYESGAKYDEEFEDGKISGHGIMLYPNGDKYDGEWNDNCREGKGSYSWVNGNRYDGEWKDDKMDGYGIFTWKSGDKYEGEFKDGWRDGKGVYMYPNGSKYDGEWKHGDRTGQGTLIYSDGGKYDG